MKNYRCSACHNTTTVTCVTPGIKVICTHCGETIVSYAKEMEVAQNAQCSYCGAAISDADITVVCPSCATEYHEECWLDGNGCATYGCNQTDILKSDRLIVTWDDINCIDAQSQYANGGYEIPQPRNYGFEEGKNNTFLSWIIGASILILLVIFFIS